MMAVFGMLVGIAIAVVAYGLGRLHERDIAAAWPDAIAMDRRLARPIVTVADGGYAAELAPRTVDEGLGRHAWGRALGSSAQTAAWAADTGVWRHVRPLFVTDPRLEAIDA